MAAFSASAEHYAGAVGVLRGNIEYYFRISQMYHSLDEVCQLVKFCVADTDFSAVEREEVQKRGAKRRLAVYDWESNDFGPAVCSVGVPVWRASDVTHREVGADIVRVPVRGATFAGVLNSVHITVETAAFRERNAQVYNASLNTGPRALVQLCAAQREFQRWSDLKVYIWTHRGVSGFVVGTAPEQLRQLTNHGGELQEVGVVVQFVPTDGNAWVRLKSDISTNSASQSIIDWPAPYTQLPLEMQRLRSYRNVLQFDVRKLITDAAFSAHDVVVPHACAVMRAILATLADGDGDSDVATLKKAVLLNDDSMDTNDDTPERVNYHLYKIFTTGHTEHAAVAAVAAVALDIAPLDFADKTPGAYYKHIATHITNAVQARDVRFYGLQCQTLFRILQTHLRSLFGDADVLQPYDSLDIFVLNAVLRGLNRAFSQMCIRQVRADGGGMEWKVERAGVEAAKRSIRDCVSAEVSTVTAARHGAFEQYMAKARAADDRLANNDVVNSADQITALKTSSNTLRIAAAMLLYGLLDDATRSEAAAAISAVDGVLGA